MIKHLFVFVILFSGICLVEIFLCNADYTLASLYMRNAVLISLTMLSTAKINNRKELPARDVHSTNNKKHR